MRPHPPNSHQDQQGLSKALDMLQAWLQYVASVDSKNSQQQLPPWPLPIEPDSALAHLQQIFSLSNFEVGVLLLTVIIELYPQLAPLISKLNGPTGLASPTFSLALSSLPEAHWDAIVPTSPLRHFRLIHLGPGEILTQRPLYIEERVMHALMGIQAPDPRLLKRLSPLIPPINLSSTGKASAHQVLDSLKHSSQTIVNLSGQDSGTLQEVAAYAIQQLGLNSFRLNAAWLPQDPVEQTEFLQLWARESGLAPIGLLLEMPDMPSPDIELATNAFLDRCQGCVLLSSRHIHRAHNRAMTNVPIPDLGFDERLQIWQTILADCLPLQAGTLQTIAAQFRLNVQSIHGAAAEFRTQLAQATTHTSQETAQTALLWNACRNWARPQLSQLVQPVAVQATLHQLVLPDVQRRMIAALISQVRQKAQVHYGWGFAQQNQRGAGVAAIFAGPSGTGKTMAAEAIAHELNLDLYRIDLSAVVSKYIGETEENLRRVFDAAETGGAILLFDEADSLFGKRTEIRDSHDRHANIEVSYLLQRMEAYGGLAILTTNLRKSLDEAFLRRMQFIAEFPFPDAAMRQQIWQGIFPKATPCENLDFEKVSRLSVAGGNIKSIARNAAYLAADANRPVSMADLLESTRLEYAKLNRTLPASEIKGW